MLLLYRIKSPKGTLLLRNITFVLSDDIRLFPNFKAAVSSIVTFGTANKVSEIWRPIKSWCHQFRWYDNAFFSHPPVLKNSSRQYL
jgi:hypothetical protein